MIDFDKIKEMSYTSVTLYEPQNVNSDFVKKFRKENDLTQYALANILCVSKKTVEKWEQGANAVKGCAAVLLSLLAEDKQLLDKLYHVEYVDNASVELCYNSETEYVDIREQPIPAIKVGKLNVAMC